MTPQLNKFGRSQSPVLVIDDFTGDPEKIAKLADALAPFPSVAGTYYPGVQRIIKPADKEARAAMLGLCRDAAPFIARAFKVDALQFLHASFSIVTTAPDSLDPRQRYPHVDSPDPNNLALLLYLRVPEGTGTAFYRQRATGIELVTSSNFASHKSNVELARIQPANNGYIAGSGPYYEQIGAVEAVPDRMVIYRTNLLHSGIIPDDMTFSADPRQGRLTANLFVRGK